MRYLALLLAAAAVLSGAGGCASAANTLARRVTSFNVGAGFLYDNQDGSEYEATVNLDATFANQKK